MVFQSATQRRRGFLRSNRRRRRAAKDQTVVPKDSAPVGRRAVTAVTQCAIQGFSSSNSSAMSLASASVEGLPVLGTKTSITTRRSVSWSDLQIPFRRHSARASFNGITNTSRGGLPKFAFAGGRIGDLRQNSFDFVVPLVGTQTLRESRASEPYRPKVGRCTRSLAGTASTGWPALRQAARPPAMTKALNPCSLSRCATRALVASRCQVQYR